MFGPKDCLLVTGATGMVGSHVVERARQQGWAVRAFVRPEANVELLKQWGVELIRGNFEDQSALHAAVQNATVIVHCAAKVGDWGPVEDYRRMNVQGLEDLILASQQAHSLKRFIHLSSLGVYPARDHYGTDEGEPTAQTSIDGYTLSKVEAEQLVLKCQRQQGFPAVVLRPGFIYGPRDRTILPRLLGKLQTRQFAFLGSPEKVMNNTYVNNLVDAIFLAIDREVVRPGPFNITDGRLVTKREFVSTIARSAGYPEPTKVVPLGVAKVLARVLETTWRLLGKTEAPLLSQARIKFLGLNLDFSIEAAKRELGYHPAVDFAEAMESTMKDFLKPAALKSAA